MAGKKIRKLVLWLVLCTLFAGLVWAADSLLSMADSNTTEAASIGAKDELAVVQTAAVPTKVKSPNLNWNKVNQLTKRLMDNSRQYDTLITQAGSQKMMGQVSDATREAGMRSAQEFNTVSQELAALYEKGNCITRAKSVRAAAKSRLANAEMVFNKINADNINAYSDQRKALYAASDENLAEIKKDASEKDIAGLKTFMIPRLTALSTSTIKLVSQIVKMVDDIRRIAGGDIVAIAGCVKQVVTSGSEGPAGLLRPMMALMSMVKDMGANLVSTIDTIRAL